MVIELMLCWWMYQCVDHVCAEWWLGCKGCVFVYVVINSCVGCVNRCCFFLELVMEGCVVVLFCYLPNGLCVLLLACFSCLLKRVICVQVWLYPINAGVCVRVVARLWRCEIQVYVRFCIQIRIIVNLSV